MQGSQHDAVQFKFGISKRRDLELSDGRAHTEGAYAYLMKVLMGLIFDVEVYDGRRGVEHMRMYRGAVRRADVKELRDELRRTATQLFSQPILLEVDGKEELLEPGTDLC